MRLWFPLLLCLLLWIPGLAFAQEEDEEDEGVHFSGKATLGADFYVISPPFDSDNISGFFNQWRFIRNQGSDAPYFVDLIHANLGARRSDETWLARVERWSFNPLNEHGLFDVNWKGLSLDGGWRRYRSDWLRVFPEGTGEGAAFGSKYTPDIPNADIFDENGRFWLRRQRAGGEISFRPEDFEWDAGPLSEFSIFGFFEGRKGFYQDGVLLGDVIPVPAQDERFRGLRRRTDQKVSTLGADLVVNPFDWFTGDFEVEFQAFREDAPLITADSFIQPGVTVLDFIPDTDRVSGRVDLSRRWGEATLQGGAFVTHLAQTGRKTPAQRYYGLDDNYITTYSIWSSFDWPVTTAFDVTGFFNWMHRHDGVDTDAFKPGEVTPFGQIYPYIRNLGEFRGNLEFGAEPMRGSRAALGYRVDYAHRDLRFPGKNAPVSIEPSDSLVRPDSLRHTFYMAGRLRARSNFEFRGELGFDWNPEVAYPRAFEKAIYFEGRGSYTFPVPVPLTLAVSGQIIDGKSPGYELRSINVRKKYYERTLWNYDVTLTTVPLPELVVFTSFTQHLDHQRFDYIRSTVPRYLPTNFYVDAIPNYESEILALSAGASRPFFKSFMVALGVFVTWTKAEIEGHSNTAKVMNQASGLRNRIITLEADLNYEIREGVSVGLAYQWQDFVELQGVSYLNYSENIHTVGARVTVDFDSLIAK